MPRFMKTSRIEVLSKFAVRYIGLPFGKYLQQGGDVREVIESLKGIRANSSIGWDHGMKIYSVPDAIAKSIEVLAGRAQERAY